MGALLIPQKAVSDWIQRLAQENTVYFPQQAGRSGFRFKPVKEGTEIQFKQYRPTIVPPGKKLAPAEEVLFRYKNNSANEPEVEPNLDASQRVIAGVRPCDLRGIYLMDRVNQDGLSDPHYLTRRAHTLIIAVDCLQPCDDHCFCAATGALQWRQGADVFLTAVGEDLLLEPLSDRGQTLLQETGFPVCADVDGWKAKAEALRAKPFGRHFKVEAAQLSHWIAKQWQSPVWGKHVDRCFSCGTCNLVCPTCYCFDVHDDFDLAQTSSGQRTKTWDSCMLPHFSVVAGGHNFRQEPEARQRHRVKRKFEYLTDRFKDGNFCVGCGRCGRQCTAGIDIFNIVSDLIENMEATS